MLADPYKVELDESLIKITTTDGNFLYYYQNSNGMLILGFPYWVMWNEYKIKMFVPKPDGLPVVLNVETSNAR
jgi:hypothetical protein